MKRAIVALAAVVVVGVSSTSSFGKDGFGAFMQGFSDGASQRQKNNIFRDDDSSGARGGKEVIYGPNGEMYFVIQKSPDRKVILGPNGDMWIIKNK